ncbi:MAG: ABC-2 transporter permease [Eubacteriales bacterium]
MKTITLNNWFSIEKEIRTLGKVVLVLSIVILGVCAYFDSFDLITPYICCIYLTGVFIPLTVRKKDTSCQWDKFVMTLPITRKEVVKGQFLFFTQLTCVFMSICMVIRLLAFVLGDYLELYQQVNFITMTFSVGLLGQSLMYVVSMILKEDISEFFAMFSIVGACIPCAVPSYYLLPVHLWDTALLPWFMGGVSIFLTLVFVGLCYLFCVKAIEKKEF